MYKNVYYLHCQEPVSDETVRLALDLEEFQIAFDRIFDNSVLIYTDASFSGIKAALMEYAAKVQNLDPYFLLKVKQGTPTLTRFFHRSTTQAAPEPTQADPSRPEEAKDSVS